MDRVTPDQVVAAYVATGIKPRRHTFFEINDGVECGCGLTAMAVQKQRESAEQIFQGSFDRLSRASMVVGLDLEYAGGFAWGFDGLKGNAGISDRRADGIRDGGYAWDAVVEAGLAGEYDE